MPNEGVKDGGWSCRESIPSEGQPGPSTGYATNVTLGSDADRRPYSLSDNFVIAPYLAGEIFQPHRLAGGLRSGGAAGPLRSEDSRRPKSDVTKFEKRAFNDRLQR